MPRKTAQTRTAPAASPPQPAPAEDSRPYADPGGKVGAMLALMRRSEGATLKELITASGWQAHSVRGAIKKKLHLEVSSTRAEAHRVHAVRAARP
jgi:hypothetical protein